VTQSTETNAQDRIAVRAPDEAWLARYLAPSLVAAPSYKIDTPNVTVKLDQNESPWDLPAELKQKIAARAAAAPWNRYPSAFADELTRKLARYAGVPDDAVLTGPGSNYLLTLLLATFGKAAATGRAGAGPIVVARPSFAHYEATCLYEGIPYVPWELTEELEYDVAKLPALRPGALVIFASPNNPVGNSLPKATLASLLARHPETLFIADEAYYEFAEETYTDLLARHANLIIVRTFSKTMGAAGVRLGYLLAAPRTIQLLRKPRVPYLLNQLQLAALDVLLDSPEAATHLARVRANALRERGRVFAALTDVGAQQGFRVKRSEANFFLLRWPDQERAQAAYRQLIAAGILVRNVSGAPGLAGCLRATLGDERENDLLVRALDGDGERKTSRPAEGTARLAT
jgi:histidinol-phosphate aminotransferase